MENKQIVGIGRTAEVLAWEEGKVIKLYYAGFPRGTAEHEARVADAIQKAGIPCPVFYGTIEVDGRPGLIYEWIRGPSMGDWLAKNPWQVDRVGRMLAELHIKIHTSPAPGAPSQRERLQRRIQSVSLLNDVQKKKALGILEMLPDGDRLCHGDFHPGNIIMASRGPLVIDWVDVTSGNPLADVARTALLIRSAIIPDDYPARRLILLFRKRIHNTYLKTYARLAGVEIKEIRAWDVPLAAARLDENIIEENEILLKIVSEG